MSINGTTQNVWSSSNNTGATGFLNAISVRPVISVNGAVTLTPNQTEAILNLNMGPTGFNITMPTALETFNGAGVHYTFVVNSGQTGSGKVGISDLSGVNDIFGSTISACGATGNLNASALISWTGAQYAYIYQGGAGYSGCNKGDWIDLQGTNGGWLIQGYSSCTGTAFAFKPS